MQQHRPNLRVHQGGGECVEACTARAAQALMELAVMLPAWDALGPPTALFLKLLAARAPSAALRRSAL